MIVKEECLSLFSFSPFCKSLVKAQIKFTSAETWLRQRRGIRCFPRPTVNFGLILANGL